MHEAEVGIAASLVLAPIPHPQPSAAIPVNHKTLWTEDVWMDDSFDTNQLYHAADGSLIQFSAGSTLPSAEDALKCEMDQLAEELETWGNALAGEDIPGGVDGLEGQDKGKLHNTLCLPVSHGYVISESDESHLTEEIGRSLGLAVTLCNLFPYASRTVLYISLLWFWGESHR